MDINAYFKPQWRVPAAIGVGAFAAGSAIGYLVGCKRQKDAYTEVVQTVSADVSDQLRIDFEATAKQMVEDLGPIRNRYATLEDAVKAANSVDTKTTVTVEEVVTVEVEEPSHDSSSGAIEWDQAEEDENRSPDSPYVISKDEFHNGQTPHRQTSLVYYAGDNILCDEKSIPLYDHSKIVGRLEFGRGSGDPDIVYIRNEKLDSEFEVTRVDGTYQAEVLGLAAEEEADKADDSLRHSVRRFRQD